METIRKSWKRYPMSMLLVVAVFGFVAIAGMATAGIIDSWNTESVVTEPGPYVDFSTYYSTIYTDSSKTTTYGAISWKHGNVQPPGLKVVNGDDVNGTNCLMTTGYNPYDFTDKQCSDPLQSSKRFKLKNMVNAPLDVNFTVIEGPLSPYRSLQKWTDVTDLRWSGFTIELGFTVEGTFVPSTAGDGLGFSDTRGSYYTRPTTSYQSKEDTLSAFYAQGLAGPADKYHPEPGYFNPFERMSFGLVATEDTITSDGVSATYSDVFGEWLNTAGVPIAIFWDDDGDINTDNVLMANCADAVNLVHVGTHIGDDVNGFTCNGQWVTFRAEPGLDGAGAPYLSDGVPKPISLTDLAPVVYTSVTAAVGSGDPQPMYMDYIEDAANLGFTFWITVDDNTGWPTPGNFTVRYTPVPADGSIPPPPGETEAICDDGIDNDGDGPIDCADPDCAGIGYCGPEGKDETCSDGHDNDGDGDIDCADSGCAKNKSCR
ncbi:MAG TPA: hypothetical protein DCO77_07505 [Nitrospiraceae bacterium]|nr:hypothetical protein [Nitrospiraceae bacterium]